MNDLSGLLVTCASHGSPTKNCHEFIMAMRDAGALIQLGQTSSDVAVTRNNQARLARETFIARPELRWLLWLDWDVSAPVDSVRLLIEVSKSLDNANVSGSYVNRHTSDGHSELACFAINNAQELVVVLQNEDPNDGGQCKDLHLKCVPALVGMGCLLQHRDSFLAHCQESDWFCYNSEEATVPCVCQQHLVHASELGQWVDVDPNADKLYWNAEDFDYSCREFDHGRPIYVVPVVFGHDKFMRMVPDAKTIFPGLLPPGEVNSES